MADLIDIVKWRIEQERVKLHDLVAQYGFSDNRIIEQSQLLDSCLNMYASISNNPSSCQIVEYYLCLPFLYTEWINFKNFANA